MKNRVKYRPLVNSNFSGGGLLDWSLNDSGCRVQQSLEYDKICCRTLKLNFKHLIVSQDIRKSLAFEQLECDAAVFTYPCNRYSTIADIHGVRTGDDLFLHAFRHLALRRPEMFVIENVPGMKKFEVVMECFTKLPDYYVTVVCPVDASIWLPQKRERLIIFGTRKPFSISPPKSRRRLKLKDIVIKGAKIEIPDYVFSRLKGKYRDLPIISDPNKDDIAPTCVAHYSKDLGTRLVKDGRRIRPYTVKEYARLQGVPDSFQFAGTDRQAYKQIGNGVAVPVGQWIGKQIVKYFNR